MQCSVKTVPPAPESDPSSIGNLAIELGYITTDELRAAVNVQQQRLPLGRILVEMGKLTEEQLDDLLFEQKVRRGEIKDKEAIMQYQRLKMRRKMVQLKDGFKEMGASTKRLTDSLFGTAHSLKAGAK
jgi:hypothetical protein